VRAGGQRLRASREEEHFLDDYSGVFLQGYHSHILYLMHLSDEEDILQSVKSALDPDCAANTDSIPEVKPSNMKHKAEDDKRYFRQHVSSSFDTISFFSTLCN
jgi:hypothetical protein